MFAEWTGELSIGIEEIDNDHKYLFDLVNNLHEVIAEDGELADIGRVLGRLAEYAAAHFTREEWVMQRYDYPHREAHVLLHSQLLDRLAVLIHELEVGNRAVSTHTVEFLRSWAMDHIAGHDKDLAEFLKGRLPVEDRQGGSIAEAFTPLAVD